MKKNLILSVALLLLSLSASAQEWKTYDNNRIAVSSDGNNADDFKDKWPRADPDDWGGTPATMAIIAKAQLGDKLVHFSYNNFVEGNRGADSENIMDIGVQSGIQRFHFNPEVFFDVTKKFKESKESLKREMAKSTAADPLYYLHMGPAEYFYQCVKECVDEGHAEALSHVYVVSHSGYNDNHLRRPYHHTMDHAIHYSGNRLVYKRIKDQNGQGAPNQGWNTKGNFFSWYWMKDSDDPNIQWLYDRLCQHRGKVADISDAGLMYYILTNDETGNVLKFKDFLGDEIIPNSVVHPTSISTDNSELLVFVGQKNTIKATVSPELTSNKSVIWKSSNSRVATVQNGDVFGVKAGKATITATTVDGGISKKISVQVKALPTMADGRVIYNAMECFNDIDIEGFVPAYKDTPRNAMAVDAVKYKDMFAASTMVYEGEEGLYDLTLMTLKELDGESSYRISINEQIVGQFKNKTTEKDYEPDFFTARKVTLQKGDVIRIESNTHSNFKVPEGEIFAFSRGRWRQLGIAVADLNIDAAQEPTLLSIEAENASLKGSWKKIKDSSASNGAYIVYNGPNQYPAALPEETAVLKFEVKEAGTYTVKWYMRQPEGQQGTDLGNDVWLDFSDAVQLAGNTVLTGGHKFVLRSGKNFNYGGALDIHGIGASWLHVRFDKPGTYTIKMSGRSANLEIDRFILYKGMNDEQVIEKLAQ